VTLSATGPALRPLAERLGEELIAAAGRRKRILATECDAALLEVEPSLEWDPGRRAQLATTLDELQDAGVLRFSVKRDRTARPDLPAFVTLADKAPPAAVSEDPYIVWRPELAWAHELALSPGELDALGSVQAFVRDRADAPVVPHRERSLELFGDEKRLDRLIRGRLFESGRLNLELLACRWTPPPIPFAALDGAAAAGDPVVLVSENAAGYHSLLATAGPPVTHVAYGGGGQFALSVAGLAELAPARVLYFGDLDAEGLAIPQRAIAAAERAGLPGPEPALGMWSALCDLADRYGQNARAVPEDVAFELCEWVSDAPVATRMAEVLISGRRVAQEAVGLEYLGGHPAA